MKDVYYLTYVFVFNLSDYFLSSAAGSPSKVRLELTSQSGELIKRVVMPNALICSKALQVIQERKVKPKTSSSHNRGHGASEGQGKGSVCGDENEAPAGGYSTNTPPGSSGRKAGGKRSPKLSYSNGNGNIIGGSDGSSCKYNGLSSANSGTLRTPSRSNTDSSLLANLDEATRALSSVSLQSDANTSTSAGKVDKSPEIDAANALIADITAILKGFENSDCKVYIGKNAPNDSSSVPVGSSEAVDRGSNNVSYVGGEVSNGGDRICSNDADSQVNATPLKRRFMGHSPGDGSELVVGDLFANKVAGGSGTGLPNTPGHIGALQFSPGASYALNVGAGRAGLKHPHHHGGHGHGPIAHGSHHDHSHISGTGPEGSRIQSQHHGIAFNFADRSDASEGGSGNNFAFNSAALSGTNAKVFAASGVSVEAVPHTDKQQAEAATANNENSTTVASGIEKFEKMLKAGVPRAAVELKMRAEGFDPALLCQNAEDKKPNVDEARVKKFQVRNMCP